MKRSDIRVDDAQGMRELSASELDQVSGGYSRDFCIAAWAGAFTLGGAILGGGFGAGAGSILGGLYGNKVCRYQYEWKTEMRDIYELLESIHGLELVLFCILINAFTWFYIGIAVDVPHDQQLYLSSNAVGILSAMLTIKLLRSARHWWQAHR